MNKVIPGVFALALMASCVHVAFAHDAVVARCHDGDTCQLANGERIRLHQIDAPETDQPYGELATARINQLVAGRHVDVQPTGDYSYHRQVADLVLADGHDVGTIMVAEGWAWVEVRWLTNPSLPGLQAAAQAAHRGLWASPDAEPPWQWRREHRHAHWQN